MKTRHSFVTRSLQTFIVTMKIEPDTDDDRRLLIDAFDREEKSMERLVNNHIASYVQNAFPGMKLIKADHEKYPTILKVYLEQARQN
ncbi:MAG TPA: hypothetical protein VGD65_18690 [Chryseosolibacter sp.]